MVDAPAPTPPAATPADPAAVPAPAPTAAAPAPADGKTLLTSGDPPKPADPPAPAPTIPDAYTFKAPEGFTVDKEFVDTLSPVFKELKLPQEAVDKIIGPALEREAKAEAKREADFSTWMGEQKAANIAAIQKEWGHDYEANLKIAQRGVARMFPDAAGQKILEDTGLGNHPLFVKAFFQVGKMIREDVPPNGGTPTGRKSNEEVFYGGAGRA